MKSFGMCKLCRFFYVRKDAKDASYKVTEDNSRRCINPSQPPLSKGRGIVVSMPLSKGMTVYRFFPVMVTMGIIISSSEMPPCWKVSR
jgi:hypothetical protein